MGNLLMVLFYNKLWGLAFHNLDIA